jgi:transcriptional regulator with XRE-family HTH domain
MKLGDKIRQLREETGLTQGQLANASSVSQGYLSQLENGEVKNPSAAVLLRIAQAINVNPDVLFEAAGYPTVRTLRRIYRRYEATIDGELLRYLARLPRDRQRRLLFFLEGMQKVLSGEDNGHTAGPEQGPAVRPGEGFAGARGPLSRKRPLQFTRSN